MDTVLLSRVLLWCIIFDFCFLLTWFLMFLSARNWIYRMHTRWFKISEEQFDSIHYAGMATFKIATWVFFIIPYLAIKVAL
jgi:hypothetical protein